MIKVLIVDDHTSVREAFKAMFEEKDDFALLVKVQMRTIVCFYVKD